MREHEALDAQLESWQAAVLRALRSVHMRFALLAAMAGSALLPVGAAAEPPSNDGYLTSISVNARGTPLTQEQVKDIRDTSEASVQSDLFSPPSAGGGVERTDCRGTRFGATVWYDFHPHVDGTVRVQAAGFDAAIGVYEFNPGNSRLGAQLDCSNEAGFTEELFVQVERGNAYTIQIGGSDIGLGPGTGILDFTFEYLADTDGDGVLDVLDKCPRQAGTSDGCPPELRGLPTLRATSNGNGIRVRSLSVDVTRGARVQVRCRRGCAYRQSKTATTARPVRFVQLRNRRLPAGALLEIFVTKRQSVGTYIRYTVTRGSFTRIVRCLRPGSLIPRRTCR